MATKDKEPTEAEKASEERVNKAAFINAEVMERLHQYDDEASAVQPAKDAREDHVYPAAPASPVVKGDAKAAPAPKANDKP